LIIYKDGILVGYTESFLEERECNLEFIDFDGIKADLITLSENGYVIEDLFYNYVFTDDGLVFFDLTSYHYLKTDVAFLKQQNFKNNLRVYTSNTDWVDKLPEIFKNKCSPSLICHCEDGEDICNCTYNDSIIKCPRAEVTPK